jgi:Zn-dependent protease with chaperone function
MATDFFDRQIAARARTARMILYVAICVVLIIPIVYVACVGMLIILERRPTTLGVMQWLESPGKAPPTTGGFFIRSLRTALGPFEIGNPRLFVVIAGYTSMIIIGGTIIKFVECARGGATVARAMGGRLIYPNTAERVERRLLNVVEEMSIASGTPVPPVYVLDWSLSINAFAAGFTPGDAVITVTRGVLEYLSRDEIQGLVAHEFSHILNGDMRLNLRLVALLNGIVFLAIVGLWIVHSARSIAEETGVPVFHFFASGALYIIGWALYLIGSIGVIPAAIVKSAVSRQREYLADASAVQFTRNPSGIAGALKKIGGLTAGSSVQHPVAEEINHMFFGPATSKAIDRLFSTHPPLVARIRRLDPEFNGKFIEVVRAPVDPVMPIWGTVDQEVAERIKRRSAQLRGLSTGPAVISVACTSAVAAIGAPTPEKMEYAAALLSTLPDPILAACHDPFLARALVFALVLQSSGSEIRKAQMELISRQSETGTEAATRQLLGSLVGVGDEGRMPLVELAMPALKTLSPLQFHTFRSVLEQLIKTDERISIFEFALAKSLIRHLRQHFGQEKPTVTKYRDGKAVTQHLGVVLSVLARAGHDEVGAERAFVAGTQRLDVGASKLASQNECTLAAFDAALNELALADHRLKRRILEACAACVTADECVAVPEAELFRATADALDCPVSPLLVTKQAQTARMS